MFMFFITAAILSLTSNYSFAESMDATPFYTVSVDDIVLSQVQITVDEGLKYPKFKKEGTSRFTLSLNKAHQDYYNKLSELEKKIFVKSVSLGLFKEIRNSNYLSEQYTFLYKKGGGFNIATIAIVPRAYEDALSVVTDYASYNDWVLKDINVRRGGEKGKYFFDVNSLKYSTEKEQKFLALDVTMTKISKGNFNLKLLIQDSTTVRPVPSFSLKMNEPSGLAKSVEGTFRFIILPGVPYFIVYFTGRAEVSWIYYKFLPLSLIQSQFVERISTMLENIQFKAESVKHRAL